MNKFTVKLDVVGVRTEILQAEWTKDIIQQLTEERTKDGYHPKVFTGYDRNIGIVYPNTKKHGGDDKK